MKQIFHKLMSVVMVFVVLFSTMSFTVDMHYCGDTLVDTAIFHKAQTCGMEMQQPSSNKDCSITKKNCCSDKQITVEGQDELKISFDKLTTDQKLFVTYLCYTYVNLFNESEEEDKSFSEYPPPLIVREIYKIDETYLI